MNGIAIKILPLIISIFLIYGCAVQSKVKTSDTPRLGEKIKIFSEPPQKA